MPIEDVREHPAEEHTEDAAAREHETEHTHRLGTVSLLCEERHEQRQRHCRDDRASDPLHRTRRHEEVL